MSSSSVTGPLVPPTSSTVATASSESIKMNYPAIVYSLDDVDKTYANDGVYLSNRRYAVTVIDKDPDTSLVQKVTNLPMSRFD